MPVAPFGTMQSGKIVVYAHVYDQADLLRDYTERARELNREGICSIDDTVARWAEAR